MANRYVVTIAEYERDASLGLKDFAVVAAKCLDGVAYSWVGSCRQTELQVEHTSVVATFEGKSLEEVKDLMDMEFHDGRTVEHPLRSSYRVGGVLEENLKFFEADAIRLGGRIIGRPLPLWRYESVRISVDVDPIG
jgi:hypothetical protein